MIDRLRNSGLLWLVPLSLVALVVLVKLGNWQMERLAWKQGLITRIEARVDAVPVTAAAAAKIWRDTGDVEYMRVRARGRFVHDKERYYFATSSAGTGWHVYTPLMMAGSRMLMVNRGFVPDRLKARELRREGLPSGAVEVVGLVRKGGQKGLFTPKNDLEKNTWFWRDLSNMIATVVDKVDGGVVPLPFFLDVEAPRKRPNGGAGNPVSGGITPANTVVKPYPKPGVTRLNIRNTHLAYALTWYGLALALIGVFLAFAWSRLKTAGSED